MKILKKGNLPNRTKIQLEDWSEHNTSDFPNLYGLTIGSYPKAKNSSPHKWVEGEKIFRLAISQNPYLNYSNDDVRKDYEALENGTKKLEDLSEYFENGNKDKYYLGMIENI